MDFFKLIYFQLTIIFTEKLARFRNQGFVFGKEDQLFAVFRSQRGSDGRLHVTPGAKGRKLTSRRKPTSSKNRYQFGVIATDTEHLHSSTRLKKKRSRLLSVNRTTAQA